MSSTRSVRSLGVIASGAATSLPGSPVAGASYRDATVAAADLAPGWKYGLPVDSAAQNEWMYRISTLVDIMDRQGILGWCNLTDYYGPSLVFGSDGVLYQSLAVSGPSGVGAKDPVSQPAYWAPIRLTSLVTSVKRQVFSASGTYTPSAGMVYCEVTAIGGGGGGGGASAGGSAGGGGGGGGAGGGAIGLFTAATVGASKTVTIGAAGAGGSAGGGAGGNGGTSSFGALLTAAGGAGGNWTAGGPWAMTSGGDGGAASGGSITAGGGGGGPGGGGYFSGAFYVGVGGTGGDSLHGGGGRAGASAGTQAGGAGLAWGAGGGGAGVAGSAAAGGAGVGGVVIVTEYCTQ